MGQKTNKWTHRMSEGQSATEWVRQMGNAGRMEGWRRRRLFFPIGGQERSHWWTENCMETQRCEGASGDRAGEKNSMRRGGECTCLGVDGNRWCVSGAPDTQWTSSITVNLYCHTHLSCSSPKTGRQWIFMPQWHFAGKQGFQLGQSEVMWGSSKSSR